ncbi:MAG: beta-propeller fold lactonase family protein [Deltaproteobacteria bacterium]|nr:beta-propeller fold lactonase family protein [Deltaproteobacteria bacterium]
MMKYLSIIFIWVLPVLFQPITPSDCDAASHAFIPNQGANTVSVIDLSDNSVIETIDVGGSPTGVAMDAKRGYVYVTNLADDTISILSVPFHSEITRVPVGDGPFGVVVSSDGEYIYVSNSLDDTVSVINENSVIQTIAVGDNPLGIAVTPNGEFVYVANNGDNTVTVISTEDDEGNKEFTIEETIDVKDLELMEGPYGVAMAPYGSYVYVTNNISNTVSVIYVYSNGVTETINVEDDGLGEGPLGVAVSPDGSYVYVANSLSHTLSVIQTSGNTVETTVDVGAGPWGVDVRNSGDFVYVANSLDNTVSVISTEFDENKELSVTDTVIVGTTPAGLGRFLGGTVPIAPTNLVAETDSAFEINLSWTDNSDDENGFKIERTRYGGLYTGIAIVGPDETLYTDTELDSYTTYYYRVLAYNDAGDSDYTNQVQATTAQEESGCFISTAMKGSF